MIKATDLTVGDKIIMRRETGTYYRKSYERVCEVDYITTTPRGDSVFHIKGDPASHVWYIREGQTFRTPEDGPLRSWLDGDPNSPDYR